MLTSQQIADSVFRRSGKVAMADYTHDLHTFNILMAVDGRRSVRTIAQEDAYDVESLAQHVQQLVAKGLLIPVGKPGPGLPPKTAGSTPAATPAGGTASLAPLQSQLSQFVGPVAGMLIKKKAAELGCDSEAFPMAKLPQLIDWLAQSIPDRDKAADFRNQVKAHL